VKVPVPLSYRQRPLIPVSALNVIAAWAGLGNNKNPALTINKTIEKFKIVFGLILKFIGYWDIKILGY